MHPIPRSAARIAAMTALTVSSGALVAVPSAMADIGAEMRFVCAGQAGTHEVGLRVDSSVPATGMVGEPIQPGTVRVEVGVPAELVDEVVGKSPDESSAPPVTGVADAPAISGVAQVGVAVQDAVQERGGGWPAFALAAAPSRGEDGTVQLTGSGVAPPVVPQSRGGLSWVAGELNLSLVPSDAATRTEEAELSLRCTAEKETVLGTVRVQGGSQNPALNAPSGVSRQAAVPPGNLCKEVPAPGVDPRYDINPHPALMKLYEDPPRPDGLKATEKEGVPNCIKATGFVNLKKADGAVPVALETLLRRHVIDYSPIDLFSGPNYFEDVGYVVNQTYPASGTVLGFGFMPTRAVAEAVQSRAPGQGENAPITGNFRYRGLNDTLKLPNVLDDMTLRAMTYVRLKVGTAAVNGVTIDLGDNCTTDPTLMSAHGFVGSQKAGVRLATDGQEIVVEDLEIPPFKGCGVTEDLSPLLTASVSGAGNYARAESGKWCDPVGGGDCVDGAGPLPETITVKSGGKITAVADNFMLTTAGPPGRVGQVTCESVTMRLEMDEGHWKSRFLLAKGGMSFEDCDVKSSEGDLYPAEIAPITDLFVSIIDFNEDGSPRFSLNNVVINTTVDTNGSDAGGKCTLGFGGFYFGPSFNIVTGPGDIQGRYDNGTGVLASEPGRGASGGTLMTGPESTCNLPGFFKGAILGTGTADFKFPRPWPEFTSP
ncbi:hypothetical protein E1200_22470 [Actinomadura sp. GC306]|uniref:DUF6801 domain-containing protein n=1 Tax=Actinomadura sp. GC306 TaxID=2530367 RepID=UPI0010538D42|nr:DUF6801 domain-containing protein [Actinomadura sp. GC306]TDC63374.1 hypothetical protein E1200_22470 [Actinomadura sp. GC306]